MHDFTENHPEFKGFSDYYRRDLEPFLQEQETLRLKALGNVKKFSPIIIALALGAAYFFFQRIQHPMGIIMPLAVGGAGLLGLYHYSTKSVKSDTKTHLVSGICKFVGWHFQESDFTRPDVSRLIENGLLPRYDRVKFEDHIEGNAHGAEFKSTECHMEKRQRDSKGNDSWRTVFRGSIMVMDFHREFLGRTVVLRDHGFFNSKKKSGMKRVGLVDPVFEKIFEAYGTDQVEARYLLTPDFMQRLVDLETSVDGKKIRFGFLDSLLLIVVETPNRFEAGSMLKPVTEIERTQKILNEIGAVYNLVDGVMKPQ